VRFEYVIIKIPYIVNPGMMDEWDLPCLKPTACGHAESSQHPENEYLFATHPHCKKKLSHAPLLEIYKNFYLFLSFFK
jgi:hypothetical protein